MSKMLGKFKHSAGLTLIELVTSMVIASIAALGLGTGITTIVGFYQDDWVTKEARFWGYEAMDYLVNNIETAKTVDVRTYLANYDGLLIAPSDGSRQLNIQGTEHDGLMVNGFPLLEYADFPAEGTYKEDGQRIVAMEKFSVQELNEVAKYRDQFRGVPALGAVRASLWEIELVLSVTTKYQGEAFAEYIKFKRIAWAKDKYFR